MKLIDSIKQSFGKDAFKYGGFSAVITVAVIVGLILVNLIFQQVPGKIDLTDNKMFSLSDQTVKILESLENPVGVLVLYEEINAPKEVAEVLERYSAKNRNFVIEYLDPEKNPALVQKYDESGEGLRRGTIIVDGEKGFKIINPQDIYDVNYQNPQAPQVTGFALEKRLTSALLFVSSGETPVIYEIAGHSENTVAEFQMTDLFEKENLQVETLNLIQSPAVPDDAEAVILFSPKNDITQGEAEKLLKYLEQGGRMMILSDFQAGDTPVLQDMLSSYGVAYNVGVVVETDQNNLSATGNPLQFFPGTTAHEINQPIREAGSVLLFQFAQGVEELATKRRSIEITPLLIASDSAFLRTDLEETNPNITANDVRGPITIAASIKDTIDWNNNVEARLVVIGSSKILESLFPFGQIPGNLDFFMNSISWLRDKKESLSVRSKSLMSFPMRLNGMQVILLSLLIVIIIPLALFITGLVIWLKRRHL